MEKYCRFVERRSDDMVDELMIVGIKDYVVKSFQEDQYSGEDVLIAMEGIRREVCSSDDFCLLEAREVDDVRKGLIVSFENEAAFRLYAMRNDYDTTSGGLGYINN